MGENALALLHYLSSADSPIPSLTSGYSRPTTVYFSHLGYFMIYSFTTAKWLYGALLLASIVFVKFGNTNPGLKNRTGVWWQQARCSVFIFGGIAGAWVVSNTVAAIMRFMGKEMSWFSREYSPLVLYGPPSLLGMKLTNRIALCQCI
jgi:hypothetical protein